MGWNYAFVFQAGIGLVGAADPWKIFVKQMY